MKNRCWKSETFWHMKRYITISTELVNIAISALRPGPFVRILSLFAASRRKCLCMKHLRIKRTFQDQAQSRPIKVNQGIFVNNLAGQSIALNHYQFSMN